MAVLEVLSGPQAGTRFPLSEKREMLLGRDAACVMVLDSPMVSRHHARVYREDEGFYVDDLGTINGTFVNSRRIEAPTLLEEGDRINLFNVALVFHADDPGPTTSAAGRPAVAIARPELSDDGPETSTGETVIPGPGEQPQFAEVRAETRLHSILEITRKLGSSLDIDEVLPRVLDILFETFPHAVNGQILLLNAQGELIPKAIKQGREDDSAVFSLTPASNAVAKQVIQTGQVALFDERDEESAIDESVSSSITAPIIGPSQEALGAIHLECAVTERRFDNADLDLLTAVTTAAGQAVEYVRAHQTLLALDRRRQEMKMAREVQLRMLPQEQPSLSGYSFHDYYAPAEDVGGDFYSYFRMGDNRRVVVTVGDVVGKGLTAALQMAQFVSEIRHSVTEAGSVKRAMRQLNRVAWGYESQFITFLLCVIDSKEHTLTVAQAGHLPPLKRSKASNTVEVLQNERRGLPLGVLPDQEFHPETYRLDPGDSLLLYTDGATEAMNPDGHIYGFERIRSAMEGIASGAAPLVRFLVSDIVSVRRERPPSDDICLVCVGRDER